MRKLAVMSAGPLLLALSAAGFTQEAPRQGTPPRQDLIARADTDGDGKVSRDEYLTYQRARAEKMFTRLDVGKDGYIDRSELTPQRGRRAP